MSLLQTWAPHFQSQTRRRGRAEHEAGRVTILEPEPGELIRAEVGAEPRERVSIRGEGVSATAHCTCDLFAGGAYCEHIWAALLGVHAQSSQMGGDSPSVHRAKPSLPKARKRAADRAVPASEPRWMGRLSLLRPTGYVDPDAAVAMMPGQRRVYYVVNPEWSASHHGLVIELRQRRATRSGWSSYRRLRITPRAVRELDEANDRQLCGLLLGAGWVEGDPAVGSQGENRGCDTFLVPSAARRWFLQRMIQTGRCLLGAGAPQGRTGGRPMGWDGGEPWVLWMVGHFVGDELRVGVELRRGGGRMPIDEPTLVIGGDQGVVVYAGDAAAFDDRGAYRWVGQFRDRAVRMGEDTSIRVAAEDVPRFLQRLYLLPQLPRIDLPEEVAPVEQVIEPGRHIALVRVDGGGPVSGGTGGSGGSGGKDRNPYAAEVWFEYGLRKVGYDQPGVYVTRDTPGEAMVEGTVEGESGPNDGGGGGDRTGSLLRRDLKFEREAVVSLSAMGFYQDQGASEGREAPRLMLAPKHMPAAVSALIARGWVVTTDQRRVRAASAPSLSVVSGMDWFELRGGVRYQVAEGEQEVSLPEILSAARGGRSTVTLRDGTQGMVPRAWLKDQGLLIGLGRLEGDHLRFHATQVAVLDAIITEQAGVEVDQKFESVLQRVRGFEGIEVVNEAPSFRGQLRQYQRRGLGWFGFLDWLGFGGILADDMGLGKTIQVLAMLDARLTRGQGSDAAEAQKNMAGHAGGEGPCPSLIVVPRSLLFNWTDEAQRFAPRLRVLAYSGSERHGMRDGFADHDVIVTSYGLLRRDITELRHHCFDYVVLDEAQVIKNPTSQSARAARLLKARHRLALTGTPVENHLGDLWSIFEFLNPGMLGSSARFARLIRRAVREQHSPSRGPDVSDDGGVVEPMAVVESQPGAGAVGRLRAGGAYQVARSLRPFILRRTKQQVLTELPPKTEQTIYCEMEPTQRRTYDELARYYRASLLKGDTGGSGGVSEGTSGGTSGGGGAVVILEALLRLRQVACHPGLIDPNRADEPSAKLVFLQERLEELIEEGHKVLVFSQFTTMLGLIRPRLDRMGVRYEYLDGRTRNRKQCVQRFQEDPDCPVFLMSLKAGGLGLNLTSAAYVFIFDPWWNPAVETQAIDRTHRIGQTRPVFAYRLICRDTVEQRVAELQSKKKRLAEAVIDGQGDALGKLSREDLEWLLG